MPSSPPSPLVTPTPTLSTVSPSTINATKKFYTTASEKPFAKSAAKRQSVQALGSIQRLQHQFLKFGLDSASSAGKGKASGRGVGLGSGGVIVESAEGDGGEMVVPPTPIVRDMDIRMPWEKEGITTGVKGEKELRKEMLLSLDSLAQKWGISTNHSRFNSENSTSSDFSSASHEQPLIAELIETTTEAIRRVQRYCVALPSDKFAAPSSSMTGSSLNRSSSSSSSSGTSDFVSAASIMQGTSSAVEPGAIPSSSARSIASTTKPPSIATTNPLLTLRKSSIEVLTMLKSLETSYRLSPPLSSSPTGMTTTNSQLFDLVEEEDGDKAEEMEKEEVEFRTDISLEDLSVESEVVGWYITLVTTIFFQSTPRKSRILPIPNSALPTTVPEESPEAQSGSSEVQGTSRKSSEEKRKGAGHRRSSKIDSVVVEELVSSDIIPALHSVDVVGEVNEQEEEREELPCWAVEEGMDLLHRTHAIFSDHLPPALVRKLDLSNRAQFLEQLSDGILLCKSYNAVLRASARPFGFIPPNSIHELDTTSSVLQGVLRSSDEGTEKKERVGGTFRRSENLRIWTGALKFRYQLAFSGTKSSKVTIRFDEKIIAQKGAGWEEMLEGALRGWVECVVLECRGEREE